MLSDLLNDPNSILIVYGGFALAGFLVFTGAYQLISRQENRAEARSRRMKMLARGASNAEVLAVLKPTNQKSWVQRLPFVGSLPRMLRQAGSAASPSKFLLVCLAMALIFGTAASVVLAPHYALALGLVLGLGLPMAVLDNIRKRRLDRMTALLPDALDLMARGLRVGHPLNTSISAVAKEMPDPVGTEFGIVADQVAFGEDLVDAFHEFADRVELEDVSYLAASIAIQHGTGSDLASIVDTLSKTIRARIALRRRIKAISAEGRLTAYFLTAVPFLIFGLNMTTNRDYYMGIADDPMFLPMFGLIIFFVVANAVVLRRLVQIRY